jgi:excisionase family DNA binding protein
MPSPATNAPNRPRGAPRGRPMRVNEVAEEMGVSKWAVYRLMKNHGLPAFQLGGKGHVIRIYEDEFRAWLYGDEA